jgi:hypothetical protein
MPPRPDEKNKNLISGDKKMKKIALATAALIALGGAAFANDSSLVLGEPTIAGQRADVAPGATDALTVNSVRNISVNHQAEEAAIPFYTPSIDR